MSESRPSPVRWGGRKPCLRTGVLFTAVHPAGAKAANAAYCRTGVLSRVLEGAFAVLSSTLGQRGEHLLHDVL